MSIVREDGTGGCGAICIPERSVSARERREPDLQEMSAANRNAEVAPYRYASWSCACEDAMSKHAHMQRLHARRRGAAARDGFVIVQRLDRYKLNQGGEASHWHAT